MKPLYAFLLHALIYLVDELEEAVGPEIPASIDSLKEEVMLLMFIVIPHIEYVSIRLVRQHQTDGKKRITRHLRCILVTSLTARPATPLPSICHTQRQSRPKL